MNDYGRTTQRYTRKSRRTLLLLNIEEKKVEFEEEQLRTQAPDFWDDVERAQEQMKKVKGIEKWLVGYKEVRLLADELQLSFDFFHDEMVSESEVDETYKKGSSSCRSIGVDEHVTPKRRPNGLCS